MKVHMSLNVTRGLPPSVSFGLDLEDEKLSLLHLTLSLEIAKELI